VPEEGEVLTLAQELGNLTLALRNDEELGTIDQTRPTTIRTLFDGERRRKVNEIRNTIEIIRGSGGSKEGAK